MAQRCAGERPFTSLIPHLPKAWMPGTRPGMTSKRQRMRGATVRYTAGEIGRVKVASDCLPPPATLVLRDDNLKTGLARSQRKRPECGQSEACPPIVGKS